MPKSIKLFKWKVKVKGYGYWVTNAYTRDEAIENIMREYDLTRNQIKSAKHHYELPKQPKEPPAKRTGRKPRKRRKKKQVYVSFGETRIAEFLDEHEIRYIREYKLCKNPKTDQHLRADFFLPDDNVIIEFDGLHHYTHQSQFVKSKKDLKEIQRRDKIKDDYCRVAGLNMVRIPYWDVTNIEEILMQIL
jgi:very-short-patch-repair endonuclease